jgi:hypothetical protein
MKKMQRRRRAQFELMAPFFVSLGVFLVLLTKLYEKLISPWDEIYHLGYIQYLYNFSLPKMGDQILEWSKYAFSCYPVHSYGMTTSVSCGAQASSDVFPELGRNVAANWPPLYYWLSSIWMRVFGANQENALFIGRSFSAFIWSIGAGVFCYALISRNKLPKKTAVSLAIVLALLPMGLFQGVFVTPHSMLLVLVSTIYLFATSPRLMTIRGLSSLILVATLSVLAVPHILPALFFITLRTFSSFYFDRLKTPKYHVVFIFSITFIPFLAVTIWEKFQEFRELDVEIAVQPSSQFTLNQIPRAIFTFIPHSIDGYQFLNEAQFFVSYVMGIVLFILIFRSLVDPATPLSGRLDSIFILSVSVVSSIAAHILRDIVIPPRYGISIVLLAFLISTQFRFSKLLHQFFVFFAFICVLSALASPVFGAVL